MAAPARRRPTSTTVARLAGVSQQTVSNVLNHPDRVTEQTRRRVLEAIEQAGFVANDGARQLRTGQSNAIAVIVPDTRDPYWGHLLRGVNVIADAEERAVLLGTSDGDPVKERQVLRDLAGYAPQGLIISPSSEDVTAIERFGDLNGRVVYLDHVRRDDAPSVRVDNAAGARQVVEHLAGLGHTELWMINGPHEWEWCRSRADGARSAAEEHGIRLGETVLDELSESASARASAAALRAGASALFCVTDALAVGAYEAARRQRREVPREVSIVGWDDSVIATTLHPRLSSVRQDPYEIGTIAARKLFDTEDETQDLLVPRLVVRDSSASPAS